MDGKRFGIFGFVIIVTFVSPILSGVRLIEAEKRTSSSQLGYIDFYGFGLPLINDQYAGGGTPQPPPGYSNYTYGTDLAKTGNRAAAAQAHYASQVGALGANAISNLMNLASRSISRVGLFEVTDSTRVSLGPLLYRSTTFDEWQVHRIPLQEGEHKLALQWIDSATDIDIVPVTIEAGKITPVYLHVEARTPYLLIRTKVDQPIPHPFSEQNHVFYRGYLSDNDQFTRRMYGLWYFQTLPNMIGDDLEKVAKMTLTEERKSMVDLAKETLKAGLSSQSKDRKKEIKEKLEIWKTELAQPSNVNVSRKDASVVDQNYISQIHLDDIQRPRGFVEFFVPSDDDPNHLFYIERRQGDDWLFEGRTHGYMDYTPSYRSGRVECPPGENEFRVILASSDTQKVVRLNVPVDAIVFVRLKGKNNKKKGYEITEVQPFDVVMPAFISRETIGQLAPLVEHDEKIIRSYSDSYLAQAWHLFDSDQLSQFVNKTLSTKDGFEKSNRKKVIKNIAKDHPDLRMREEAKQALLVLDPPPKQSSNPYR